MKSNSNIETGTKHINLNGITHRLPFQEHENTTMCWCGPITIDGEVVHRNAKDVVEELENELHELMARG